MKLLNKEELKKYIDSDLYRLEGNSKFINKLKNLIIDPSFKFIVVHRKCNYYRNKNKISYLFYKILLYRYNIKYGFEISNKTKIGKGFYIGHRGSIVINTNVKIGNNFSITSGVTIGQENRGKRQGTPTIGDCVWIGANSIIVGSINIGNNVLISPGSFVNFDVPSDSIVIGNPAVIKRNKNATKGYITWIYGEGENYEAKTDNIHANV